MTATAFLILHTGRSHTQGSCADGYLVVEPGWDGGAALPDAQEARCAPALPFPLYVTATAVVVCLLGLSVGCLEVS